MKLKKNADLAQFLKAIPACDGEVFFLLGDNEHLNLSSLLSRYVFSAACAEREFVETGIVSCKSKKDYTKLAEFLQETDEQERGES